MKIEPSSLMMRSQFSAADLSLVSPQAPIQAAVGGHRAHTGFLDVFEGTITQVDAQTRAAADRMHAVDAGQSDDLVGAMLASQEASLSFSMLMQVRNKVMGAVDEIVKLQV